MGRLLLPLLLAVCLALPTACAPVRDGVDALPQQAGSVADQAGFCFSVARALQGVEAGSASPDVLDAAEEVLTQAPDDLREHASVLAEAMREAAEEHAGRLAPSDAVHEAVAQLREGARTMCAPRD